MADEPRWLERGFRVNELRSVVHAPNNFAGGLPKVVCQDKPQQLTPTVVLLPVSRAPSFLLALSPLIILFIVISCALAHTALDVRFLPFVRSF